ncbi:MAG: hypothetical protein ACOY37_07850 [Pseudomonadota bacterium]
MTYRLRCHIAIAALSSVVAACLFLPGLGGAFIFDDGPNIVHNAALRITALDLESLLYATYSFQPGEGSRPLSMLSFALDYWRAGLDPAQFKATNLLIHALTTAVLALFLRHLLVAAGYSQKRANLGSLAAALIWAVHPLQVSTVLYVVQRMQMLCTLFMILSLWAYLGMRRAQLAGVRSRNLGALALLFWAFGLASKEDAVLLPSYALILELTVLHFGAADPRVAGMLRKAYALLGVVAITAFALLVPGYWYWDAIPGREFSTPERLLTQGRVLAMYLGQIALPLPSRLPFYYDELVISRSLFEPASTLSSLLLLAGLIGWAWAWRHRRPVFAFGVLLFFAGHALTSNVLNLELAFEHRNHLPLIGIVLAATDLGWGLGEYFRHEHRVVRTGLVVGILVALSTGTWVRARAWGEPVRFALHTLDNAPRSPRAWMELGAAYVERSGGRTDSPDFARAIETNEHGARLTGSPPMWSNVILYKARQGGVPAEDWRSLLDSLRAAPANAQNQAILWVMLDNVDLGTPLDERGMIEMIEITTERHRLDPSQYRRIGAYVHNRTSVPAKALPYFRMAVSLAPANDTATEQLLHQLDEVGREDWSAQLRRLPRANSVP